MLHCVDVSVTLHHVSSVAKLWRIAKPCSMSAKPLLGLPFSRNLLCGNRQHHIGQNHGEEELGKRCLRSQTVRNQLKDLG